MSMEQFSNREPEPNGPIDDPLSHNAHLKVGGLETHARAFSHAGDCSIYATLINGCATDGICTCGYGWSQARQGDLSQMLSAEREGVQQPKGGAPCQSCAQKDQQLAELKEAYLKVVQIGLEQKARLIEQDNIGALSDEQKIALAKDRAITRLNEQLTVERNWTTEGAKQNMWLRNRVAELEKSQGIGADAGGIETPCQACAQKDQQLAEKDQQIADSDEQVKILCADWAEDDTAVKSMAAPYIGDFDGARPAEERGLGFRGVVEVTEALVAKLAESNAEIARLNKGADEADQEHGSLIAYIEEKLPVPGAHGISEHISWAADEIARLKERIDEMTGLLESSGHRHWQQNIMHDPAGNCRSGCSRCIWEAMKARP